MSWIVLSKPSSGSGADPYRIPYDIAGFSVVPNPLINAAGSTFDDSTLPAPFLWQNVTQVPAYIVAVDIDYRVNGGNWTALNDQNAFGTVFPPSETTGFQADFSPLTIRGGPPFGNGAYAGEYRLNRVALHFRLDMQSQYNPFQQLGAVLNTHDVWTIDRTILCEAAVVELGIISPFAFTFDQPPND